MIHRRTTPTLLSCLVACVAIVGAGCSSSKRVANLGGLTPAEAYEQGRLLLEQRHTDEALEAFQTIDFRFAGSERQVLEPLVKLGIADATFYQGSTLDLIDARQLYLDFVTLYGDHPRAPYAQFQAGVCSLEQAGHPSKDQSQTHAAFRDLREVERRFPGSRYASASRDMIRRADSRLAEHEFLVGMFYFKRKHYLAATDRFLGILDEHPRYDSLPKVYYYLGEALLRADNGIESQVYLEKLLHDYPDSEYRQKANRLLTSPEMADSISLDQ